MLFTLDEYGLQSWISGCAWALRAGLTQARHGTAGFGLSSQFQLRELGPGAQAATLSQSHR